MNLRELTDDLSWGLHDAHLEHLDLDWPHATASLTVRFAMSERQDLDRRGRIDLMGLVFCAIDPPEIAPERHYVPTPQPSTRLEPPGTDQPHLACARGIERCYDTRRRRLAHGPPFQERNAGEGSRVQVVDHGRTSVQPAPRPDPRGRPGPEPGAFGAGPARDLPGRWRPPARRPRPDARPGRAGRCTPPRIRTAVGRHRLRRRQSLSSRRHPAENARSTWPGYRGPHRSARPLAAREPIGRPARGRRPLPLPPRPEAVTPSLARSSRTPSRSPERSALAIGQRAPPRDPRSKPIDCT